MQYGLQLSSRLAVQEQRHYYPMNCREGSGYFVQNVFLRLHWGGGWGRVISNVTGFHHGQVRAARPRMSTSCFSLIQGRTRLPMAVWFVALYFCSLILPLVHKLTCQSHDCSVGTGTSVSISSGGVHGGHDERKCGICQNHSQSVSPFLPNRVFESPDGLVSVPIPPLRQDIPLAVIRTPRQPRAPPRCLG